VAGGQAGQLGLDRGRSSADKSWKSGSVALNSLSDTLGIGGSPHQIPVSDVIGVAAL
jgi:hypothetical protein